MNKQEKLRDHIKEIHQATFRSKQIAHIMNKNERMLALNAFFLQVLQHPKQIEKIEPTVFQNIQELNQLINSYIQIENQAIITQHDQWLLEKSTIIIEEFTDSIVIIYQKYHRKQSDDWENTINQIRGKHKDMTIKYTPDITNRKVQDIVELPSDESTPKNWVRLTFVNGSTPFNLRKEHLYSNKSDTQTALEEHLIAQKDELMSEIDSIESFIRFLMTYNPDDQTVAEVIQEKAPEFGIDPKKI